MYRSRTSTLLYAILGTGVALAFLGHGVLGAKAQDTFLDLVTGSYDKLLGGTMSHDTAVGIVNAIGWIDVALFVVSAGLVYAAIAGKRIAYSRLATALFAGRRCGASLPRSPGSPRSSTARRSAMSSSVVPTSCCRQGSCT